MPGPNPFITALTRIEHYAIIKNRVDENYWGWSESQFLLGLTRRRNEAVAFLIQEGLMGPSGSLLPYFCIECTNPFIAEAARYAQGVFGC